MAAGGMRSCFATLMFARSRTLPSRCRCFSMEANSGSATKRREFRKVKAAVYTKNRHDPKMEKEARMGTLQIPLKQSQEEWLLKYGTVTNQKLARHYGIFEHIFGGVEFAPHSNMKVSFGSGCEVHCGNLLTPTQASCEPTVQISSTDDTFWTLLLTNPDGSLTMKDSEMLHWMVGNIPGERVQDGDILCEYLPPVPPHGTGVHRFVFCLFQQSHKFDFDRSQYHLPRVLSGRTFSTAQFLARYPGQLTPTGLRFFQSKWDESVSQTFAEYFGVKEPVYQPRPFVTPSRRREDVIRNVFEENYRNK